MVRAHRPELHFAHPTLVTSTDERFLSDLPPKAAAAAARARERLRAGDDSGALAELEAARVLAPDNPGLLRMKVEPLLRLGRNAEAVESAHDALDAHPENHDGFVLLLYHLEGMKAAEGRGGEESLLIEAAKRAARAEPRAGWPPAVMAALLGSSTLQIPPLKKAVGLDPKRAWMWAFLGRALGNDALQEKRGKRRMEGLAALTRAARLAPRSGWILCWRAEVLKKLGRSTAALRDLDAGLRLMPGYHLGRAWRAPLLSERGSFSRAAEDLTVCYEHLRRPNFLEKRARMKAKLGDETGALEDLAECVRVSWLHALATGPMPWTAELPRRLPHQPPCVLGRTRWRWRAWKRAGKPAAGPCFFGAIPPLVWRPDEEVLSRAKKPWAELWRGQALLMAGRPREALRLLDAAVEPLSKVFAARLWRACARRETGNLSGALSDLNAAVALAPQATAALAMRGIVRLELGRQAEGISDLVAAARTDALNAPVLGVWLRAVGLSPRARRPGRGPSAEAAELELYLGNAAGARRLAARARPSARAAAVEGWALAALGRPGEFNARASSDILLEFFKRLPALPVAGAARVYDALASEDARLGRWEDRLRHLELARRLGGRTTPRTLPFPAALAAKAQRLAARRPTAAFAAMSTAMSEDPTAACARDIIGEGPSRGPAWALAWRGARRRACGRLSEARADFDAACEGRAAPFWARAWRGELALVRGDAKAALKDLEAACAGHPRWGQARSWLARALTALGEWERGEREARAALAVDARDPWAAMALGLCLQATGRVEQGAALVQRGRRALERNAARAPGPK